MQPALKSDSNSIAYLDVGAGPRTVVLLHGWMVSGQVWRKIIPLLRDCRLIIPDLRGVGLSAGLSYRFGLHDFADDVIALIEKTCTDKVHLVGHSMGGQIAQLVAHRRTDLLASLTLLNPVPINGLPLPPEADGAFRNAGGQVGILSHILDTACRQLGTVDRDALLLDALEIAPDVVREMYQTWSQGTPISALSGIDCKTLILATDDPFLPPAFLQSAVADLIRNATLVHLPGPGHYPQVEATADTARILEAHWLSV